MVLRVLGYAVTTILVVQAGFASTHPAAGEQADTNRAHANQGPAGPTRTGKERLDGKGSDEQRLDNCRVPLDRRGEKPRPDICGNDAGAAPAR